MNINLEGLTLDDGGITLNLDADQPTVTILDHCLIGRVLTDKEVRFSYLCDRLGHIWHPVKGVTILPAKEGRYLFQFNHKIDADNVMKDGPWVYDSCNVVVERITPSMVPKDVSLDYLDIWVQVHNLPFGFMQLKVGQAVGAYLGEFKEYDSRNTMHNTFMKLKVRINVTEPLKQEWQVRTRGGEWVKNLFKYERLGTFCYACGILGHPDRTCELLFDKEVDDGAREWGANLKPNSRKIGTPAKNRWLRDPVKVEKPSNVTTDAGQTFSDSGAKGTSSGASTPSSSMVSLGGRINALHKEIHSVKQGISAASGSRNMVLGLDANPIDACETNVEEVLGSDLKKRKCVLAVDNVTSGAVIELGGLDNNLDDVGHNVVSGGGFCNVS